MNWPKLSIVCLPALDSDQAANLNVWIGGTEVCEEPCENQ